jgi:hypothetical protein
MVTKECKETASPEAGFEYDFDTSVEDDNLVNIPNATYEFNNTLVNNKGKVKQQDLQLFVEPSKNNAKTN